MVIFALNTLLTNNLRICLSYTLCLLLIIKLSTCNVFVVVMNNRRWRTNHIIKFQWCNYWTIITYTYTLNHLLICEHISLRSQSTTINYSLFRSWCVNMNVFLTCVNDVICLNVFILWLLCWKGIISDRWWLLWLLLG